MSAARAYAVGAYLVAHGVPAGTVEVEDLGFKQPSVPTPLGVREPLNRKVLVIYRAE